MSDGATVVLEEEDTLDASEDEDIDVVVIEPGAGKGGESEYIAAADPGLMNPINGSNPGFVSSSDDSGAENASADRYIADDDVLFLIFGGSVPEGGSGLRIFLSQPVREGKRPANRHTY